MNEQNELTIDEVAEYTNRSRSTVTRWLGKGWLAKTKNPLTRRITISKAAVDKLLTEGPPQQSEN